MIRSIALFVLAFIALFVGISMKTDGNAWCIAMFGAALILIVASYLTLESFLENKKFWAVVRYSR